MAETEKPKTTHGKPDGMSWEEYAQEVLRLNRQMSRAIEMSDQQFQQLAQSLQVAQDTVASLEAQLTASRISNTELAKRINDAGKSDREELMRVRELCKAAGISLD